VIDTILYVLRTGAAREHAGVDRQIVPRNADVEGR
jgi:hypothetical protein